MSSKQHESLCAHNFIQQILINKHIPGFVQGPWGLEAGRTPAQFLRGLQCNTRDGHAKHFLQYSELPPRRYLQKTLRTSSMERASAWRNQGNTADGRGSHWAATYPWLGTRHADRQAKGTAGAQAPRPRGTSKERVVWLFSKWKGTGS